MKITLKIKNEDKTFTAPFVSTRRLKETLVLSNKVQKGFDEKIMDELGEYMTSIYGKQFTLDELYDGFPANEFFKKAINDMQEIIGTLDEAVKN